MGFKNIEYRLGDIRDDFSLWKALHGCTIAIHAAAMLDLIMAEKQPTQAYLNNLEGSKNFIEAVMKSNVKKAIAISTDKAASPSNVYGMTKYIMEKMFIEANQDSDKEFLCVRFGNMIDSKFSLVSFWKNNPQADIKLTHPKMERFFFKIEDAVEAVINALEKAKAGDIFVPKMKKAKIIDILKIITGKKKFEIIGLYPGEKIYEDLIGDNEKHYSFDHGSYFLISPGRVNQKSTGSYSTKNASQYNQKELRQLIYG